MPDQDRKVLVELPEKVAFDFVHGRYEPFQRAKRQVKSAVKAALASPQPQVEEEYRVVGVNQARGAWEGRPHADLGAVQREANRLSKPGPFANTNIRIQRRTVISTEWVDLQESGGGE